MNETPRICYEGGACFLRVCPECARFVKADSKITVYGSHGDERVSDEPNATCSQHGRISMPFEGWF